MKIKNKKLSIKFKMLIIAFMFCTSSIFAYDLPNQEEKIEQEFKNISISRFSSRLEEGRKRLASIQAEIIEKQELFDKSLESSIETEKKILETRKEIKDLQKQLSNINKLLEESNKKIDAIKSQIYSKEITLESLYEEKEIAVVEAENQREVVLDFFRTIQQESVSMNNDEVKITLKLLLADNSFSSHLRNEVYLDSWEKAEREIFHALEDSLGQMEETENTLNKEKKKLEKLSAMLIQEKRNLSAHKQAKENIIKATQGKQEEYEKLWRESRKNMLQSNEDIKNLEEDMENIRSKLQSLESQKREIFIESTLSEEDSENSENFEIGKVFQSHDEEELLSWPVSPENGITAYYKDESYEEAFGIEHDAIDIRCSQGTPIKSPLLGFVYKTVDNGMGYSYIILVHRNNISTVYGHISKILVKEGETVHEGDIIGLSGGTPGTQGAGVMTTGPHLHFEVFEDGEHKNPLDYLSLDELPIEYIPDEYIK